RERPGAVRIAAVIVHYGLAAAVDRDGARALAAHLAAIVLIRLARRERAVMASVRVAPFRGVARAVVLQRITGVLDRELAILLVEIAADLAADEAAEQNADADRDGAAAALSDLRADGAAGSGAAQRADGFLRAALLARGKAERQRGHAGDHGGPDHLSLTSAVDPVAPCVAAPAVSVSHSRDWRLNPG